MSHHHSSGPQSEASRALRSWSQQRAASLEPGPTLLESSAEAPREAHKAPSAVDGRELVTKEQLDKALDALRREFSQQLGAARRPPGDGLAQGAPAADGAGDREAEPASAAAVHCGASSEGQEPVATTVFDVDCELGGATRRSSPRRSSPRGFSARRSSSRQSSPRRSSTSIAITPARHGGASQEAIPEKSGSPRGDECALAESIWDAAMLIGCERVGLNGSLFTAAAFVLNVLVQFGFCVIVNDSLTRPRMDAATVADFTDWRTTVAHNLKYVNDITKETMARKVCTFGDTPMAAGPIDGLSAISEYRPNPEDGQYRADPPLGYWMQSQNVGEAMCLIALIVWWLTALKEIFSIMGLGQALYSLPTAEERTEISDTAGGLKLKSMSRFRKAMAFCVLLVRSFICLTLAVCGTLYLASTISLGDLLLNALALEIVLTLDELTFEVLIPHSFRLMISSLAPLPKPPSRAWRGLDARPVAASIAIVAGAVCVHLFVLRDQSQLLQDAREALCGGNWDFIATIDQTGMVVAYEDRSTTDYTSSYEYRTLRSLIQNQTELETEYLYGSSSRMAYAYSGMRVSIKGLSEQSISEMTAQLNPRCYDMDWPDSQYWPLLSDILNSAAAANSKGPEADLANISSCVDVAPRCAEATTLGVRARQYCPVTCGCNDPAAALVLSSVEEGCPVSCVETELFTQAVGSLSCEDWTLMSPQTLGGTDLLDAYLEGLRQAGWPALVFGDFIDQFELMLKLPPPIGGCPKLIQFMASDENGFGNVCDETNWFRFRPIAAICPVSCGCRESGGPFCPTAC